MRTATALDRLEDWLGLKDAPSTSRPPAVRPPVKHEAEVGSMAHAVQQHAHPAQHGVDVLVHAVAPTDSLESIALKYGADVRVVRRSNHLWLGDVAQMREQIYIPVDACRWKPPNADIKVLQRRADGSFEPQEEVALVPRTHRSTPSAELAKHSLAALPHSGEATTEAAPPIACKRVDPTELLFFGSAPSRPAEDHGESGVDDLLRLQQRRREGREPLLPSPPKKQAPIAHIPEREETWRPNVWKFGQRSTQREAPVAYAGAAPLRRPQTLFDAGAPDAPPDAPPDEPEHEPEPRGLRLDELLKGPPTNPGAAANWVRPIHWGESLPALPGQDTRRNLMSGFLSDMTSARSRMEDMVGAAMHELRQVSLGRPANEGMRLPM